MKTMHLFALVVVIATLMSFAGRAGAYPLTDAADRDSIVAPTRSAASTARVATATTAPSYKRYGLQTMGADVAAIGLTMALARSGISARSAGPLLLLGGYLFAAPGVHWAYGNRDGALRSLAVRASLPFLGGLAGAVVLSGRGSTDNGSHEGGILPNGALGFLFGGFLGIGAAIFIDSVFLAKKRLPQTKVRKAALTYRGIRATPSLSMVNDGGMTAGLTGTF